MGLEKVVWLAKLQNVKCTVLLLFVLNGTVFGLALWLLSIQNSWPGKVLVVIIILVVVSGLRVFWLGAMGFAQVAVASVMITAQQDKDAQAAAADDDAATQDGSLTQRDRRRRYKLWLWGGRVGFLLACLQVVGAAYLTHVIVEKEYANIHHNGQTGHWQKTVLVILNVFSWAATVVQCCVGSNMMAWHSLYKHDEAWRAHYREVFNHGIREALCCLGKSRYLSQLKNDEVDSVAALLGDLVAYRAQGAGHLEVLAGVAMLKNQPPQLQSFSDKYKPAPAKELLEASNLQPYAVAAYTGLLLDIGRNPLIFPCAWLYRQGVLAPWNRSRRPVLQGDNWWRGHAAAFLKHVNLPPEALRKGRVSQANGEAVYFVVVLHELRTVLVAIRGTETPEDLLTDGLSQECLLSDTDLLGLLTGPGIDEKVRSNVKKRPHYAHIGIVNAARELSKELDNLAEDDNISMTLNNSSAKSPDHECVEISESSNQGLLSRLLGSDGDCKGYKLRLVGHSLGGAVAALTGLRLRGRYPKLHVYAFGVLPCIDAVTAEACKSFVTSVVYNDEFSSRLSVASMMRLRTNALNALASDSISRNSSSRQHSKVMRNQVEDSSNSPSSSGSGIQEEEDAMRRSSHGSTFSDSQDSTESGRLQFSQGENRINRKTRFMNRLKGGAFLCAHTCCCMLQMSHHHKVTSMASELNCEDQEHINKIEEEYSVLSWSQNEGMTRCNEHELMSTASFSHGGKATRVALNSASQVNGLGGAGQDERYSSCVANGLCTTGADSSSDESPRITENAPPRRMFSTNLCTNGMPRNVGSDFVGSQLGSDLHQQYPAEMFIPGLVIHVIRDEKPKSESSWKLSFWYMWRQRSASDTKYQAILTDRESFSNIVLSPAMFLDHMPWKCQHALNMVVKELKTPTELSRHDSTSSDNAV